MKLIVLAAGKGERLMPLTKNTPKPLLDLGNGNTLLEEQLERVEKSGAIEEVVLVIGYLAEQIEAKLRKRMAAFPVRIRTIFNPFYETTNNLVSLWLGSHEMNGEDFAVTNGDNLFAPDVFSSLCSQNSAEGIYLSVVTRDQYSEEDMKVRVRDGTVVEVSKAIPCDQADAESVGLALVRGEKMRRLFVKHIDRLVRDRAYLRRFWLETFNSLYQEGVPSLTWPFLADKWQEVDFHMDVAKARSLLMSKVAQMSVDEPVVGNPR